MQDETSEHQESSRNLWFSITSITIWQRKFQEDWYFDRRILRKFSEIAQDVTPADCGLDLELCLSPQSPVITARNTQTCNGVVGGQYRDCTGICMGNDAS